jgi:hypothetical protein
MSAANDNDLRWEMKNMSLKIFDPDLAQYDWNLQDYDGAHV